MEMGGKRDFPDRRNEYKGPKVWKDRNGQRAVSRKISLEHKVQWRELLPQGKFEVVRSQTWRALYLELKNWTLFCWLSVSV